MLAPWAVMGSLLTTESAMPRTGAVGQVGDGVARAHGHTLGRSGPVAPQGGRGGVPGAG